MARKSSIPVEDMQRIGIMNLRAPLLTVAGQPVTATNWRVFRLVAPGGYYVVIDEPRTADWELLVSALIDRIRRGELSRSALKRQIMARGIGTVDEQTQE